MRLVMTAKDYWSRDTYAWCQMFNVVTERDAGRGVRVTAGSRLAAASAPLKPHTRMPIVSATLYAVSAPFLCFPKVLARWRHCWSYLRCNHVLRRTSYMAVLKASSAAKPPLV